MGRDKGWLVPLTGVAFLLVAIVGFMISGDTPNPADDSAREIVDFYVDNKSSVMAGSFLEGLAAALLVFFGAYLREVLRVTAGGKDFLSTAAFAGALIIAVGFAFDGTINLALAETAEDIDPAGVQALIALYHNDFIPFAVGSVVFLVGTGISVLQHGALPKWIGWIALVLAVMAFTPIGFVAFIGSGILIAVMGVTLAIRGRAKPAAT
ncbi:MAG: DUF4386 family protein [Solirubrobacteraceae bacterium]